MFGLGMGELVLIGIAAFIFIGPKKLPQLGSSLAQGIKNFKLGMNTTLEDKSPEGSDNN
ncbi:MAG: twin-arginine translocase TatA/TatE family subunit [Bacteriovoracaceae bacterium]|nr:twin-arginine translocase TatA/TatE family subunit [Bacteriovoracaceae bacterium]